jgi:hypothetical protein
MSNKTQKLRTKISAQESLIKKWTQKEQVARTDGNEGAINECKQKITLLSERLERVKKELEKAESNLSPKHGINIPSKRRQLGQKIKDLRDIKGASIADAVRVTGLSYSQIFELETGNSSKIEHYFIVAAFVGHSIEIIEKS